MFWNYFIAPAIIFTIDKTISLSRKKKEIQIEDVELLPSGMFAIKITFKFQIPQSHLSHNIIIQDRVELPIRDLFFVVTVTSCVEFTDFWT